MSSTTNTNTQLQSRRRYHMRGSTATNLRKVVALDCSLSDDAERRYRESSEKGKKFKQKRTYDSMKVDFIVKMKKNKSVKSALKNWWLFRRMVNLPEKKMKQLILSAAVVGHILSRDRRTQEVGSGLYKIGLMVVLPFMVPPAIVVGIPTLVLFLPLLTLVWAIVTLNRHAKKVLLSRQRVKKQPTQTVGQRLANLMNSTGLSFQGNMGGMGLGTTFRKPSKTKTNKPLNDTENSIASATSAITATTNATTNTTCLKSTSSNSKSGTTHTKTVSFSIPNEDSQPAAPVVASKFKKTRSKSWSFRPRISFHHSTSSSTCSKTSKSRA